VQELAEVLRHGSSLRREATVVVLSTSMESHWMHIWVSMLRENSNSFHVDLIHKNSRAHSGEEEHAICKLYDVEHSSHKRSGAKLHRARPHILLQLIEMMRACDTCSPL
jgi:hypothetical protein